MIFFCEMRIVKYIFQVLSHHIVMLYCNKFIFHTLQQRVVINAMITYINSSLGYYILAYQDKTNFFFTNYAKNKGRNHHYTHNFSQ